MDKATWGLWYWPAFIITTVLLFAPPESYALATDPANTLSDFAWRQLGFPRPGDPILYSAAWYFSFTLYIIIVVFLGIHIWFRRIT